MDTDEFDYEQLTMAALFQAIELITDQIKQLTQELRELHHIVDYAMARDPWAKTTAWSTDSGTASTNITFSTSSSTEDLF
jgi:hypothetical protein